MTEAALAAPATYPGMQTSGPWATERESAASFDRTLAGHGLFTVYSEVRGILTQPRLGQVDKAVRIDRLLMPTAALRALGWAHGAIGVEIKRSGVALGPILGQATDYVRSSWLVLGIWIQLGAVFVWPVEPQSGPLASLMTHHRVGSASFSGSLDLNLKLGEEGILRVPTQEATRRFGSQVEIGDRHSGRHVGSR